MSFGLVLYLSFSWLIYNIISDFQIKMSCLTESTSLARGKSANYCCCVANIISPRCLDLNIFEVCGVCQRVLNNLKRARFSRGRMIWLLAQPSPPHPSVSSTGDTQEDWERETTCWRETGGRGWEGKVAKLYDRKKAWPSINYSILSDVFSGTHSLPPSIMKYARGGFVNIFLVLISLVGMQKYNKKVAGWKFAVL